MLNVVPRIRARLARRKQLNDVYLRWLSFANAGMSDSGNYYLMDLAIRNLPTENPAIEIGSFCGLSTNVITYLLGKHGKSNRLFTCDRWVFEGSEGGEIGHGISHAAYREYVRDSYIRNVQFFSPSRIPYTIELFADQFFEQWANRAPTRDIFNREVILGGNIAFAYIDGNHTYDCARRDFENTDRHLDAGGYILFDDSSDVDPFGLTRLMREIEKSGHYELILKNPNYMFRKIAG